ncbi:sulfite exporter TauE/SafE family protein [Tindallia californiensis]|uniref:Uncharacterized membrane protein YfcA n=1 Tax=Tindallia californiensis TaxID=159292 RepID=A0A1H3M6Y8_9FIRM|nr:sulfite exporter TauE/SafE family protein [Tindallia californiensis]SDY72353.1 Uncharacterized membrane protein YfcA [Tindallia californiensis]
MIITGFLAVLGIMTILYVIKLVQSLYHYFEGFPSIHMLVIGFVTDFFDSLGIGSFAPTASWYRHTKMVNDRIIPGTMLVGHTLPVVTMAFIFIQRVEVDPLTLVFMIIAAALGAHVGADIVSGLSETKVQFGMGFALIITAIIMILGTDAIQAMPASGDMIGLDGAKLMVAVAGNFILGALMSLGVGLYAPCMALVYLLGMDQLAAFPIMMGSCAFLMPIGSIKFIKHGAFDSRAAVGLALGGVPAVVIAATFISELPMEILTWLVIGVISYTAFKMLRAALPKESF